MARQRRNFFATSTADATFASSSLTRCRHSSSRSKFGDRICSRACRSFILPWHGDRLDPTTLPADVVGNFEDLGSDTHAAVGASPAPGRETVVAIRGGTELDRIVGQASAHGGRTARERSQRRVSRGTADRRRAAPCRRTVARARSYSHPDTSSTAQVRSARRGGRSSVSREASAVPVYGAFDTLHRAPASSAAT